MKDLIADKINEIYGILEQEIYEVLLKDNGLKCTCDQLIREDSFKQAQCHYHHCMLWQVTRAIEITMRSIT